MASRERMCAGRIVAAAGRLRGLLLALALLLGGVASAQEAPQELTGSEVARRVNERDEGESVSQAIVMELIDRRGTRRVRETLSMRRYYGEEKRTVIFFEAPKNVKGTGFLTYDYPEAGRDDDQWLYLSALRKVRRISSSDRGDYFLGTDFTYEDIKKAGKLAPEDYRFEVIGEESVDEHLCIVLEGVPVSEKIAKQLGYSRLRAWVDPEIWMVRQAKMWDVQENPLKIINRRDVRKIDDIWTVHRVEAFNYKTGHRTILTFRDVDYDTGVRDDVFTERALRRGP